MLSTIPDRREKMVLTLICSRDFTGSFPAHAQWPELKLQCTHSKEFKWELYGLWTIVAHLGDLLLYKHASKHLSSSYLIFSSAITPRNFKSLRLYVHQGWIWLSPHRNSWRARSRNSRKDGEERGVHWCLSSSRSFLSEARIQDPHSPTPFIYGKVGRMFLGIWVGRSRINNVELFQMVFCQPSQMNGVLRFQRKLLNG